jgi:uncharacterized protein affecting Mg2+/Co2+ transport
MISGLDLLFLEVNSLEESLAFYEGVLGMEVESVNSNSEPPMAKLRAGELKITLAQHLETMLRRGRGVHFFVGVEDVDQFYDRLIENGADVAVQLLSRSWTIVDGRGTVHEVVGEGVVGEMPLIAPGASFDYVSGCPLDTPSGAMSGTYRMVDEDGTAFDVEIPRFQLLSA